MTRQMATEEFSLAQRQAQKEYKELVAAGKRPHPLVLDELLPDNDSMTVVEVGLVDIPSERIVGVKSAGRITAFTPSFRPLLESKSEFGVKWIALCEAHLGDTGITDPILCYEYLGNFYIQEGNKRVSVLRYFDAPKIPGYVRRILPAVSEEPRIRAYYEFLEFYKTTGIYHLQFRRPGDYTKFLSFVGKKMGEPWTEREQRTFNAYYHYFLDAFHNLNRNADMLPEEALLLWLELYPYRELGSLTKQELKKRISALWEDIVTSSSESEVNFQTKAEEEPGSLMGRLLSALDQLDVAFVHQLSPETSAWVAGHEEGKDHIEKVFGDRIIVRSYYNGNTPEKAEALIEQAVQDGAEIVFTTAPPMRRETLKAAVEYPKVKFLNCSVDQHYSSVRSYYGRMYEAKFISGAIAGAIANDDRIGYIASYPIFGVPSTINAFALGAQMTNPRAQIELRWSCVKGNPQEDFFADGIRVISNRSALSGAKQFQDFCNYGTYLMDDLGELIPLGTPIWDWGKFYEFVIRTVLAGGMKREKGDAKALNYWLGMDNGIVGVKLSDRLPEGVRQLANLLQKAIADGTIDPFHRRIVAQDGTLINDGTQTLTPEQLIRMDWLCDNVVGSIPSFEEILPYSQKMVRELGIYRDRIPPEKEGKHHEDFDHLR